MNSKNLLVKGIGVAAILLGTRDDLCAINVTINARTVYQTMDGFGSSERVFDDPHVFENFNPTTKRAATVLTTAQQDAVLDRLYVDLKLTRVRPACPETALVNGVAVGIEPQNDNSDPNLIDWNRFNFAWKNLDAHIDYIQRARQRGVTTFFLSALNRETWLDLNATNAVAEYAEWLLALALRCDSQGVTLPYLSVANEPSYSRNTMGGHFMRDVIKILGPKLRAANLPTLFVIPDDVRSTDAAAKASIILSDPMARSYVGALATHLYDESITNIGKMKTLAQQYGLPLWMTEFSLTLAASTGLGNGAFDWADLIHELIWTYDVSAIDYQWGFFGQWESGSQYVKLNYDRGGTEAYKGYTLNKEYYVTGQFSRFIAQGSRRIQSVSTDTRVKVSAFVDWPNLTIVAVNNTSTTESASFDLVGMPALDAVNQIRTSATENWASLPAINVSGTKFNASLPAKSVTTFTGNLGLLKVGISLSANNVTLSWPVIAVGFKLQATDQLPSTYWSDVTVAPITIGDQKVATFEAGEQTRFFRLKK